MLKIIVIIDDQSAYMCFGCQTEIQYIATELRKPSADELGSVWGCYFFTILCLLRLINYKWINCFKYVTKAQQKPLL